MRVCTPQINWNSTSRGNMILYTNPETDYNLVHSLAYGDGGDQQEQQKKKISTIIL